MARRLLCAALIGCCTFVAPVVQASKRERCRFQDLDNHKWTDHEVRATIRCYAARWRVPGGRARALEIARRESGFEWDANNPASTALGVYQPLRGTWASWRDRFRKVDRREDWARGRKNARANVGYSLAVASRSGWDPWQ